MQIPMGASNFRVLLTLYQLGWPATGPVVNGIIVLLYNFFVKKREIDYNHYVICFILEVVFGLCII
jgi:hypothetical protein